jgi:hypothetical protein
MLLLAVTMSSQTVAAEEPDLQDGDLFVGAAEGRNSFGLTGPRIIWRVRDGVAERYCEGHWNAAEAEFFGVPEQMMVDSDGRIVFIAKVGPEGFSGPRGLFRCNGMGSPVERLAYFSYRSEEVKEGFPDPFPDQAFNGITNGISGLHLARVQSIEITGDHQRLITEDAYVMAMEEVNPETGARIETKVRRYRSTTGQWDVAPDAASDRSNNMPAMVNYGGATYSAVHALRKSTDPLRVDVAGSIGEFDFALSLSLFGGHKEVEGLIIDDSALPNVNSGCDPELPQPPSLMEPRGPTGAYSKMSTFQYDIVYDGYGGLGLVLRSPSGAVGVPYLTNVSEALINDDPGDDLGEYFYRSTTGCRPEASLKHTSIVPFTNPDGVSGSNEIRLGTMTASPHGLVGMVGHPATRLVRIVPGVGLETIADGFVQAGDVAAYPAVVPPASGAVVLIQINSPVDVLVTDADGNRIGVDHATGEAVNDFGQNGFDSGPGEPRFLAIKDPTPGAFDVDTVGTGDGPFSIQLYSAPLGQPQVDLNAITVSGIASIGSVEEHDFTLASDAAIAFVATKNEPLIADAGSDQTVELSGSRLASVTLDGSDSTDDSEVRPLSYTWALGDVELGAGEQLTVEFPIGVHTVSLTVDDGELTATDEVEITVIDLTPPEIIPGVSGTEGNNSWYVSDVEVSWSVVDLESDISSITGCDDASVTTDTAGQTFTCEASSAGGSASEIVTVKRDATPPDVTADRTPEANAHGWNNTDVTVSFSCEDALSGVESCADPVTLSNDGAGQSVTGTGVDQAGNTAEAIVGDINIDATPPTVTYFGNEATYTVDRFVEITCEAADALSGVERDTCAGITGAAYEFDLGTNTFSAEAVDLAGNTGIASVTFVVEVTYASLCNLTNRFLTNQGVARSLCEQLDAAERAEHRGQTNAKTGGLEAYVNHVEAQAGKTLTNAEADILIRLVGGL